MAKPPRVPSPLIDRRGVLRGAGAIALGALLPGVDRESAATEPPSVYGRPPVLRKRNRVRQSHRYRTAMAKMAARRPLFDNVSNGDEESLDGFVGNYSKVLPHDALGHVDPAAYAAFLKAAKSGMPSDFDRIPLGLGRKLVSAQAAFAFELEGCDSHHTYMPPPPAFSSAAEAAEMVELYWMALCRDVPFSAYDSDPLAQAAAAEIGGLAAYPGTRTSGGAVDGSVLFRGAEAGCAVGPYLSQFLWQDVPYGAQAISQRSQTVTPGHDYLTDFESWLAVQNGADPRGTDLVEPVRLYPRSLRDMGRWVQIDALYQAYLNATLILLGRKLPFAPGIPSTQSVSCEGFVDWGAPHLLALVCEVSTRALKAVWYHKWLVHRRLRPEEFGGRVHNHLAGRFAYPIDGSVLNSNAVARVFSQHGTYLLPMAFPEGSPAHCSYGSGHATVAGACTTILKAWFQEDAVLPNPVVPSADGTSLDAWTGAPLTVGHELNKVAANIAIARNGAGVHWFSDYYESMRLGEYVAKTLLEEQKPSYNQSPTFRFTSFDGHTVTI